MSEADKIIESLKNSGRKVEEFYTGNKGSDKNVANIEVIEDFILELKSFGLNKDTLEVANELENLLAEREQKDKRIKELEEENKILEFQNKQVENYAEELKKYNKTVSDRIVEYKKNNIPIQVVIEAISVHQDNLLNQATTSNPTLDACFRDREKYAIQVLQELLEGEK